MRAFTPRTAALTAAVTILAALTVPVPAAADDCRWALGYAPISQGETDVLNQWWWSLAVGGAVVQAYPAPHANYSIAEDCGSSSYGSLHEGYTGATNIGCSVGPAGASASGMWNGIPVSGSACGQSVSEPFFGRCFVYGSMALDVADIHVGDVVEAFSQASQASAGLLEDLVEDAGGLVGKGVQIVGDRVGGTPFANFCG